MHLSLGFVGCPKTASKYLVYLAQQHWPEACARYKDEYYTLACAKTPTTFSIDPVKYRGRAPDSVMVETFDNTILLTVDTMTDKQRQYFNRLLQLPFWRSTHAGT